MDFGFTPASTVLDAPFVYVNPYTNEVWRPSNYEHNYKGERLLHTALALSRNTCTVRVAQQVGVANIVQRAKALGLEPHFPQELAISLGAVAVSPLNLTQAYAAFANQGLGVRPRIITSITDEQAACSTSRKWNTGKPSRRRMPTLWTPCLKKWLMRVRVHAPRLKAASLLAKLAQPTKSAMRGSWAFRPTSSRASMWAMIRCRALAALNKAGALQPPYSAITALKLKTATPKDDFVMPEGIVMSDGLAFRADQPMQGASATAGATPEGTPVFLRAAKT